MKKGQIAIFVVIGLMICAAIVLVVLLTRNARAEIECVSDLDCVPADCCHPDSCVAVENAPSCAAVSCTAECQPGTLDCGQGSCLCVNGRCRAFIE